MLRGYKIIGVCLARIQEPISYEFISELKKRLEQTEYRLFVYNACSDLSLPNSETTGQAKVYDMIDYNVVDVLVLYEDRVRNQIINDAIIAKAQANNVPVIIIGQKQKEGCITIDFDDNAGIANMIEHVIDVHGAKKLHFMGGTRDNVYSQGRIETFKRVLEERNMPFDESMVSYGEFWAGPAKRETQRIIDSGELPDAIICANDNMALAVCSVLKRHGIRVPEEVMVTGYDGILEAELVEPKLTTAKCSHSILADTVLDIIQKREQGISEEGLILVEPESIFTESCGCPTRSNALVAEYASDLNGCLFRFQTENVDLTGISGKVQRCENVEQIAEALKHSIFYDMCVVVEKRFLEDEAIAGQRTETDGEKEYILLSNSDVLDGFKPEPIKDGDIVPQIDYLLENNRYIIFNALSYLDMNMGYVCFFFSEDVSGSFYKVPQSVTFLGYALGGYINIRHEHYLKDKIDKMYRVDPLTGLYNRRGFAIEYQKMLDEKSDATKLTVLLADVDKLKKVNDIYGHAAGDVAISTTAAALRHAGPEGTIYTRFGGDEMLAVCPGEHDTGAIRKRFYEYLERANKEVERPYTIAASIGIYVTDAEDNLEFEELITKSDKLMYMEKEKRRSLLNKEMLKD